MPRLLCFAVFSALLSFSIPSAFAEDEFTLQKWNQIETQAERGSPRATGLRDGYLAGVRDTLRVYSRVGKTFPICWPKDHEIDIGLVSDTVDAVRKGHPDIAKPQDNFAYIAVLSLYDAYPCR